MSPFAVSKAIVPLLVSLFAWVFVASAAQLAPHEVTNAEYKKFVEATGHPPPEYWTDRDYPAGRGDEPVVLVTWYEAMAYCQWKDNQRLPTQEEWQEACRSSDFEKWGNIWEWTMSDAESPAGWKILCGPRHTCTCGHEYHPANKNLVKGFRCTLMLPLAFYPGIKNE